MAFVNRRKDRLLKQLSKTDQQRNSVPMSPKKIADMQEPLREGRLTAMDAVVQEESKDGLSSKSSGVLFESRGKSRIQELTEKATHIHAMERERRAQNTEEIKMYRRIMNEQQLKTFLATRDLQKDDTNFKQMATEFAVCKNDIQKTIAHMAQQMMELDDEDSYNITNRMDKQKYNNKLKMDMALAKAQVEAATSDVPPVTLEPPQTPRIDMDKQMIFQDRFIQAIKDRDLRELPRMIEHASQNYCFEMEALICWAELELKRGKEKLEQRVPSAKKEVSVKLDPVELMYHRNIRGQLVPNHFPRRPDSF